MTFRSIPPIAALLLLVAACSGPEADWVYGSWTEELSGQTIEFGEDKKVRWFNGVEGTFSFAKNDELLCLNRCPDGILVISVDGQTFRTPFRTNSDFTDWAMEFQNRGGVGRPTLDVLDKNTSRLMLRRAEPGLQAFDVSGFEKLDDGLETLYVNMMNAAYINGQIVGEFWSDGSFLAKFDTNTQQWVKIDKPTWSSVVKFGGSVIRYENNYSLDNGTSWRDTPSLSDAVPNVANREPRFLGAQHFQIVDQPPENSDDWASSRPHFLYMANLASASPSWTKTFDFPSEFNTDRHSLNLQSNEALGELYVTAFESFSNEENAAPARFLVSRDQGVSFQEETIPEVFTRFMDLQPTSTGLVATSYDFETKTLSIHTYTSATRSWDLQTVQDNRLASFSGGSFIDGESLIGNVWGCGSPSLPGFAAPNTCDVLRVGFDGSVSVITSLPPLRGDGFQTPHLTFVNGELFLSALTLWRLSQP